MKLPREQEERRECGPEQCYDTIERFGKRWNKWRRQKGMINEIGNQKSLVSQKPKKGTVSRKINVLLNGIECF